MQLFLKEGKEEARSVLTDEEYAMIVKRHTGKNQMVFLAIDGVNV